jgi:hypothetical protein
MTHKLLRTVLSIGLLQSTAGCGEKLGPPQMKVYPVSGKLTVNGKPIVGIQLVLIPTAGNGENQPVSKAATDAGGSFKVSTYSLGDGAPAGTYKLTTSRTNAGGPRVTQIVGLYSSPSHPVAQVTINETGDNALAPIDLKGQ